MLKPLATVKLVQTGGNTGILKKKKKKKKKEMFLRLVFLVSCAICHTSEDVIWLVTWTATHSIILSWTSDQNNAVEPSLHVHFEMSYDHIYSENNDCVNVNELKTLHCSERVSLMCPGSHVIWLNPAEQQSYQYSSALFKHTIIKQKWLHGLYSNVLHARHKTCSEFIFNYSVTTL